MTQQFQQQLLKNLPRLSTYALKLTRNRHDAEDLVQSTAMLALRFESRFIVGTNLSAWLFRILKNRFISNWRSEKRRPIPIDSVHENALGRPGHAEELVLTGEVIRAMDKLNPQMKRALIMVCSTEMSYQEAAEEMSCTVGTVKSRIWRARERMKALLGTDGLPDTSFESAAA